MEKAILRAPVAGNMTVLANKFGKAFVEQDFTLPSGKPLKGGFVFMDSSSLNPVIVLPVTGKGEVVVVRQFRYCANEFIAELPGGCGTQEESAEDILRRELLEETGYEAGTLVRLGHPMWFEPVATRCRYHPYLALGCRQVAEPAPDEIEIMEIRLVPLGVWIAACTNGEVTDDKSVAVTMRALSHLGYLVTLG